MEEEATKMEEDKKEDQEDQEDQEEGSFRQFQAGGGT